MADKKTNPVKDQDRVRDLFEHFEQYGDVMFRQQRAIYEYIATQTRYKKVLEVGCGNGVGSAILAHGRSAGLLTASDVSHNNIKFARCLYPWITFIPLDVRLLVFNGVVEDVVAVEVLEHVSDPQLAINNMVGAAKERVWISTPNGTNKPRPPENPYHVCEYTPDEVLGWLFKNQRVKFVNVLNWDNSQKYKHGAVCFPDGRHDPLLDLTDPLIYCATVGP
jgi:2-polyprenyl-3-methyl-5-hydroxy-6-metoxy-1,4-benzoquinol methylase